MAVYKGEKTNTWRVVYRVPDWKGVAQSERHTYRHCRKPADPPSDDTPRKSDG